MVNHIVDIYKQGVFLNERLNIRIDDHIKIRRFITVNSSDDIKHYFNPILGHPYIT